MRKALFVSILASALLVLIVFSIPVNGASAATPSTTTPCAKTNLFGIFVPWDEYLTVSTKPVLGSNIPVCAVDDSLSISSLSDIWLIGLAIFDDLLRLAGLIGVAFVIYGGIRYITSQGEPENTRAAQSTILNALIGVAIAVVAAATVSFIASSLGG